MIRQFELVERVKAYDPSADEDALNRAYVFAMKAHGSQKRASGDPYFSHSLEVAGLLAGMRLDEVAIAVGLLHDLLEDDVLEIKLLQEHLHDGLGQLVYDRTGRRPMILPGIVEV